MFRYAEFKVVNKNDSIDAQCEARAYNRSLLAENIKGIPCVDIRLVGKNEEVFYSQFIPFNCHIYTVEEYENGALNLFVRDMENKVVGVVLSRPLSP